MEDQVREDRLLECRLERFDELVGLAHATATAPLRIDCSTMKVAAMRDRATEFFRRHGPGVVVIDYLQLASPAGLDLEKQASRERAVAACVRAQHFGCRSYGAIKNILRQGLDLEPLPSTTSAPTPQLAVPRFARSMSELLHRDAKQKRDDDLN